MRRPLTVAGLAVAGVVACSPFELPGYSIPEGAIAYVIEPDKISYIFTDSGYPSQLYLRWLPDLGFTGYNCIALLPRSPTDTIGDFVFVSSGPNTGNLYRDNQNNIDTTAGIFLTGVEGTHGTFAVTSTGLLHLFWADGVRARYFDTDAVLELRGDTIVSDVSSSSAADSTTVQWHVRWLRGNC